MDCIPPIEPLVCADDWRYRDATGKTCLSRLEIGQPRPAPGDPNGDWCCPVSVEGFTDGVVVAYGVGAVDALMNAMVMVRTVADEMGSFVPRGLEFSENAMDPGDGGVGR